MSAQELVLRPPDSPTEYELGGAYPAVLVRAGKAACFAADVFFSARISNPHTRTAYARAVGQFLSWCEDQDRAKYLRVARTARWTPRTAADRSSAGKWTPANGIH